jgi:hypothetical protein
LTDLASLRVGECKTPRAQEEQLLAHLLQGMDVVAAIDEAVALADDLAKVADAVGELHGPTSPDCAPPAARLGGVVPK